METLREIWVDDDPHADHYEIGPDRDGLGCVEIRSRDPEGKIVDRMSFPPEIAVYIADAISKIVLEMRESSH